MNAIGQDVDRTIEEIAEIAEIAEIEEIEQIAEIEVREHERDDFDALYAAEYEPMLRVAFLLVLDRELALDVTHDAFARVYERWSALDRPGAYLRTAVINASRDALRRRRYRWSRQHIAHAAPAPAAEADYLADALAALHPKRRAAIVLRYYLDASETESAAALGVRPGTVKSLLHRGLADLRVALEEPPTGQPPTGVPFPGVPTHEQDPS